MTIRREYLLTYSMFCSMILLFFTGCASFERQRAMNNAVDSGLIGRLDHTSEISSMTWSWPGKPYNVYSDIGGLSGKVKSGTYAGHHMTFFLGKSIETGKWEVFSAFAWEDGAWKSVPVILPRRNMALEAEGRRGHPEGN